jgi:serine/threonine protein kinase
LGKHDYKFLTKSQEIERMRMEHRASGILNGRYRIIDTIGSGGFGITYLVEDQTLGYPNYRIAKQLTPPESNPKVINYSRKKFAEEAKILERMGEHSQIPKFYDQFEENGEFYIIQEYIEGQDLSKIIAEKQLDETEIIKFLKSTLKPLGYIHKSNVIHRDVKPSNLIRRDGDREIVTIDFGAVKELVTLRIDNYQRVTSIFVIGTQGYMAPEQAANQPRTNSDIYSLGIVCIEALTKMSPQELKIDAETGEIIWPEQVNYLSLGLQRILQKMVRRDWKTRYSSVQEIEQDLETLTNQVQPANPPVNPFRGAVNTKNSKNKRLVWAAYTLLGLGLLAWGIPKLIPYLSLNTTIKCEDNRQYSSAECLFLSHQNHPNTDSALTKFKRGNYQESAQLFREITASNKKEPELVIYGNNAQARLQGSPIKIGVVISNEDESSSNGGKEILRGVADAQTKFNSNGGYKGNLLEVIMVNETQLKIIDLAARDKFAKNLKDAGIVAVIGHRFSDRTKDMILAYEKHNLLLISSTSTLSSLDSVSSSGNFMRTVPSGASLTQSVADNIPEDLRDGILVVYNSKSEYSKDIRNQLDRRFDIKVDINLAAQEYSDKNFKQFLIDFPKLVKDKQIKVILLFPDKPSIKSAIDIAITQDKLPKRLALFGDNILYQKDNLKRGGSALEGLILSVPRLETSCYIEKANEAWGNISWRTQTSFDAAQTLITLIEESLKTHNTLSSEIILAQAQAGISIPHYANLCNTSGQEIRFLDKGDFAGKSRLVQLQNGKFVPYP